MPTRLRAPRHSRCARKCRRVPRPGPCAQTSAWPDQPLAKLLARQIECAKQLGIDTIFAVPAAPGSLVSLCFASANYDETVFDTPEEVRLDRKPNPHVAFGFGPHLCLGAAHARLVVRTLLKYLCEQVGGVEILAAEAKVERETRYHRPLAWDSLTVRFASL